MTVRRRASSLRAESAEPSDGLIPRQTRSSARRTEALETSPNSKSKSQPEIPQRGTRRRRRRSIESVATNDFPKSSADYPSPKHSLALVTESGDTGEVAPTDTEQLDDSYEDGATRLQDMLDFDIPKLARWCDKARAAVASLTHPKPTAEERKNFNTARRSFNAARHSFAKYDAAYIDCSSFNLPYHDPDAQATVQNATCSANLVSILFSVVNLQYSNEGILPFLQELDNAFPVFFDPEFLAHSGGSDLPFRVRCRCLVEQLSSEPNSEPLILAAELFCKASPSKPFPSTLEEARQRLREGPYRKLGGIDIDSDKRKTPFKVFKTQMNELITTLSLPERTEIEESLNTAYPKRELLQDLRSWSQGVYVHPNEAADGNSDPSAQPSKRKPSDSTRLEESESLSVAEDDEAEHGSDSGSDSDSGEYDQLPTLAKDPSFIRDLNTLAAVRQSEKAASKRPTKAPLSSQRAAKGKQTASQTRDAIRRLDPTQILEPHSPDQSETSGTVSGGTPGSSPQARKRLRSPEDGDSVDDDFEVNEQLIDETRRIRYEDSGVFRPAAKRARFPSNPEALSSPRVRGASKTVDRPSSREDTPADANLQERDIFMLSQAARANRLANKEKRPQIRKEWTAFDTNHLVDLIADPSLNCSWSAMEKRGGFQTYRSQQSIRDKARLMKRDILQSDAVLPPGFDYVYLGRKERDQVIEARRNPDRTEDDIDEDGRVTNYMWTGR
ncbi:hypothetical protein F5Y19DRAFT_418399 [Xylariaceae sp. FL1651]|nr:hypothetical protein F5Y19DRAFT_418399 [Xylariaceae sp. FL1651]